MTTENLVRGMAMLKDDIDAQGNVMEHLDRSVGDGDTLKRQQGSLPSRDRRE